MYLRLIFLKLTNNKTPIRIINIDCKDLKNKNRGEIDRSDKTINKNVSLFLCIT